MDLLAVVLDSLTTSRAEGVPFAGAWRTALWRARRSQAWDCVDADERAAVLAALKATRTAWERAFVGRPALAGEQAIGQLLEALADGVELIEPEPYRPPAAGPGGGRRQRGIELRRDGWTWPAIAAELGYGDANEARKTIVGSGGRASGDTSLHRQPATHCAHGHPLDEANTYVIPSTGSRMCRRCGNDRRRRLRERKRERQADQVAVA